MGADLYIDKLDRKKTAGYFRDSYNISNLLWQYGLSYWGDINKKFTKDGRISVEKIKELIKLLNEKEDVFKRNMVYLKKLGTNFVFEEHFFPKDDLPLNKKDRKKYHDYYIEKNKNLFKFLKEAIKLNSPITASL